MRKNYLHIVFWRILRKCKVFNYWYTKFLNELMFDLEMIDISQKDIYNKYLYKLDKMNNK